MNTVYVDPSTGRSSPWRPMTPDEQVAALALSPTKVRYPVASPPKRLARSLAGQASSRTPLITDAQAEAMWGQVYRFRRQIPAEVVKLIPVLKESK